MPLSLQTPSSTQGLVFALMHNTRISIAPLGLGRNKWPEHETHNLNPLMFPTVLFQEEASSFVGV